MKYFIDNFIFFCNTKINIKLWGCFWIRQNYRKNKVHAEERFASIKNRKKISANNKQNYALAA